ncbi:MAG: hypothetical protein FJ207_14350 [Gemmatimonadetes bacterium]|nr:hypothetical protein [Gemmatimonadota bacterium]
MPWTRSARLVALAFALLPVSGAGQVVVRDDVEGWAWLAALRDRTAIVQLAFGSSQSSNEGRLDEELLEALRGRGLQRTFGQGDFDPTKGQVMAECTGTDWVPQGATSVQMAMHAEVSYWDQSRLSATEIWEALSIGAAATDAFSQDAYVQGCARLLMDVLTRLGFDQG